MLAIMKVLQVAISTSAGHLSSAGVSLTTPSVSICIGQPAL